MIKEFMNIVETIELSENAIREFATAAHEEWRQNFDPSGTKPRIKKNSDGTEGDINVPFNELHPDWQAENLAAGLAAEHAVKKFPGDIEKAAEYIHIEWMKRNLPNTRIIENDKWGHIDHGFFMVDDDTVICINEDWVPNCLKGKKLIAIEDYIQVLDYSKIVEDFATTNGTLSQEWIDKWLNEWKGYVQDVAFDSNVLVIDSKNILFSSEQPKLFKFLEQYGITCHVVNMRHSMFWEGGIHCLTLDVKRRGERRIIVPLTD